MLSSDWYENLIAQQKTDALSARERQEIRALLLIDTSTRLFRKRITLWLKHMSVAVGAAVVLSQMVGPAILFIKWFGGVLP